MLQKSDQPIVTSFTITPSLPHIRWEDLTVGELIGHGGYGDVYCGEWQGVPVAIKQLHLKTLDKSLLEDFEREASLMARCSFPYIVRLYGVCVEPAHAAMVMEYLPRGSLYSLLKDSQTAFPWNPLRWQVAIGIGKGLAYLHSQSIIHRDLKSLNILLDERYEPKIGDFGLSKIKLESASTGAQNRTVVGSTRWLAPELFHLEHPASPSKSSDVYSYGMVLWEIAARQLPYLTASNDMMVSFWIAQGKRETVPSDCPAAYGAVIQQCWETPEKRPSAETLMRALTVAKPPLEPVTVVPPNRPAKTYLEKSWHFDRKTKKKAKLPNGKDYMLLPATKKDIKKVVQFYQHHAVSGYGVSKVEVIYNPSFDRAFEIHIQKLQNRDNQPAFVPKWSTMAHADVRQAAHAQFLKLTQPYTDPDCPAVKLLPAWHGTKPQVLDSLFSAGYVSLGTTDNGFFGKGYYSAYEAEYSHRVYCKGALILNWVASYSPLPVVADDMKALELEGKSHYGNYDAHFVPVKPRFPDHPNETVYYPCQTMDEQQYTEMVVFDSAAMLPRYLVELQATLLSAPILKLDDEDSLSSTEDVSAPITPASTEGSTSSTSSLSLGEMEYQKGNVLYNQCQYPSALPFFEAAAKLGYPAAYLRLGFLYAQSGRVGPRHQDASAQWYQKAAQEIEWFKRQAEKGHADAQCNLGRCYSEGLGVARDDQQAAKYYQLAAKQKYAPAQSLLGWCYESGTGVKQDAKQAFKYYRLAAKQNYAAAQYNVARCYAQGKGVTKKNLQKAVAYYRLAADQGEAVAQTNLGYAYYWGKGVKQDMTEAVKYYRLAADQGEATAQYSLGNCAFQGQGMSKNYQQAIHYYQLAAAQGMTDAQNALGICYEEGKGVAKDAQKALDYYLLAASQGSKDADRNLQALQAKLKKTTGGQSATPTYTPTIGVQPFFPVVNTPTSTFEKKVEEKPEKKLT